MKQETKKYLDTDNISKIIICRTGDKITTIWWDNEGYYHEIEFWPSVDANEEKERMKIKQ